MRLLSELLLNDTTPKPSAHIWAEGGCAREPARVLLDGEEVENVQCADERHGYVVIYTFDGEPGAAPGFKLLTGAVRVEAIKKKPDNSYYAQIFG